MDFTFTKLQHIGIPVTNLKVSEAFYVKLGFENVMSSQFDHEGEKGNVAMMKKGDIIIELYQFPEKALGEIRGRSNGHIDHIAFDVENITLAMKSLMEAGFEVLERDPVFLPFWKQGCKYFFILGPDGERLEFNQIL